MAMVMKKPKKMFDSFWETNGIWGNGLVGKVVVIMVIVVLVMIMEVVVVWSAPYKDGEDTCTL